MLGRHTSVTKRQIIRTWCDKYYCCRRTQTETERSPKLSGNKFIEQASRDTVALCPKAEPREQRGLSLYTI
jgi:hypothetical protein